MQKIRVLIFTDFWNKSPEILAIGVSGLQIQYVVRWPGNPSCVWFKFLHNTTSTKTNKIEKKNRKKSVNCIQFPFQTIAHQHIYLSTLAQDSPNKKNWPNQNRIPKRSFSLRNWNRLIDKDSVTQLPCSVCSVL